MSDIKIAFGVTSDWLKYTYVTMCSILSNANLEDNYKFYIMCDSVDTEFFKVYEKLNQIHPFEYEFIKMNNSDFDGYVHDIRVGVSASYRLKLASLVKEEKIIYLDSDIVVEGDIAELWGYNIEDYLIGAVEDKYSSLMTCHANLEEDAVYINSGVMLMNLKKFREQNLEEIIFEKLRENTSYSDQDVINDTCRGQILYLPLKYNLMVIREEDANSYPERREEYQSAIEFPFIIHYAIKPWIVPVQYSEYWFKYFEFIKH